MVIGINCGHTIAGTMGCGAKKYLTESDETRAVGYALMDMLKDAGHTVIDCTDDVAPSECANLRKICEKANAQHLDIFISIHFNAGEGQGCETYTYGGAENCRTREINRALANLGFKNRGIKDGSGLRVIKDTTAPAALVEVCFVDTKSDADLYKALGSYKVAQAIFEGITGDKVTSDVTDAVLESYPKTVYSLNDVHVQVIDTWKFKLKCVDCQKENVKEPYFANAGFFAKLADGSTIPVGNLVIDGKVITDARTQPEWLSTARKKLTTLVIHNDNSTEFVCTDDMSAVADVKYAISGAPIIRGGYKVPLEDIKKEGYDGGELYDTWHGFVGIRNNRLVYVAAKLRFDLMVYLLEVLGVEDAIKLDGGGSFILRNGAFKVETSENRRINNILIWEG